MFEKKQEVDFRIEVGTELGMGWKGMGKQKIKKIPPRRKKFFSKNKKYNKKEKQQKIINNN